MNSFKIMTRKTNYRKINNVKAMIMRVWFSIKLLICIEVWTIWTTIILIGYDDDKPSAHYGEVRRWAIRWGVWMSCRWRRCQRRTFYLFSIPKQHFPYFKSPWTKSRAATFIKYIKCTIALLQYNRITSTYQLIQK